MGYMDGSAVYKSGGEGNGAALGGGAVGAAHDLRRSERGGSSSKCTCRRGGSGEAGRGAGGMNGEVYG